MNLNKAEFTGTTLCSALHLFAIIILTSCLCYTKRASSEPARHIWGTVADKLGKPVANARLGLFSGSSGKLIASRESDEEGKFFLSIPKLATSRLRISKPGWWDFELDLSRNLEGATDGFEVRLIRRCHGAQVLQLQTLNSKDLYGATLDLLACLPDTEAAAGYDIAFFQLHEHLGEVLRRAVTNSHVAERAVRFLCISGNPTNVEFLVKQAIVYDDSREEERAHAWIAGALVRPYSELAWNYLEKCLERRFSAPAYYNSILALTFNNSERSKRFLSKALRIAKAQADVSYVSQAVRVVEGSQAGVEEEHLDRAIERYVRFIPEWGWNKRVDQLRTDLNRKGDRALVRFRLPETEHATRYLLSLARQQGKWVICGIWIVGQS
jgi:tetratricopeptide (TPR) repeat protein